MPGTIQSANKTISKHFEKNLVFLTLVADGALEAGQEVYLSATDTVKERTTGAQFPIGVASTPCADTERVSVATCFQRTLKAKAIGGAFTIGQAVKPNGTVGSDGVPEYVACAAGDHIGAIVITTAAQNGEARLGVLRTPIKNIAQAANIATVATANASDLATAIALANALKTALNSLLANLKTGGEMVAD